jgi:type I thyroxine 5'-deiodinase
VVYIQEAHSTDAWQTETNIRDKVLIPSARTAEDRSAAAMSCVRGLKIDIPAILDDTTNSVEAAYSGWPDRLYVVDAEGCIAYKSEPGPYGFKPAEVGATLGRLLPAAGAN